MEVQSHISPPEKIKVVHLVYTGRVYWSDVSAKTTSNACLI